MKRRFVRTILASLATAVAVSAAGMAEAQELQLTGPLKGAPAVRHLKLYRKGRFEIAPSVGFSLLDEYRRTILVGARLNYNLTDWLAIGVWGAGGVASLTTDLTDKIDVTAPRDALTAINVNHTGTGSPQSPFGHASFADQTAKMSYAIAPQVTFTPFRGKLAIFNKIRRYGSFHRRGRGVRRNSGARELRWHQRGRMQQPRLVCFGVVVEDRANGRH